MRFVYESAEKQHVAEPAGDKVLLLAWVGVHGWKRSVIGAAVIVGVSYRIVRGGRTQGVAEAILFVIPVVVTYAAGALLPLPAEKRRRGR